MTGIRKLKGLTLCVILSSFFYACTTEPAKETPKVVWHQIVGETQGTTYTLILEDTDRKVQKQAIDSILNRFDLSLSTYIDNSIISSINEAVDSIRLVDSSRFFARCYTMSSKIYELTEGAFDPSVYPLVKAWGFYGDELWLQSDQDVSEILKHVSFEDGKLHRCNFQGEHEIQFYKNDSKFKLDFNAIAQGFSVDVIAEYLNDLGIKNYYVEIGGEITVKGKNKDKVNWRIGVDSPNQKEGTRVIENVVHVTDKAIATSGNYRKFYEKNGVKYAHTIDPRIGKPVQHSLLSATVISSSCAQSDAYATAFMVMGVEKSMAFVKKHPELELEIYLIYDTGNGTLKHTMSAGFKKYLK